MNREIIVEKVKAFNQTHGVSLDDVVVGYGAAAVLHGLRYSTTDIDVSVHPEEFDTISGIDGTARGKGLVGEFVSVGDMDFHKEEHEYDCELIDDVWVVGKRTLLRQYLWLFNHPDRNPEKRKKDILVIKALRRDLN